MKFLLTVCIGSYWGMCGQIIKHETETLEDCQRIKREIIDSAKADEVQYAYCRPTHRTGAE